MTTLHGILVELGIAEPDMHPERQVTDGATWTIDESFRPELGKSYEVAYGKIAFRGMQQPLIKRVRIDGPAPAQWFDLDENARLDPTLHAASVRGFRRI